MLCKETGAYCSGFLAKLGHLDHCVAVYKVEGEFVHRAPEGLNEVFFRGAEPPPYDHYVGVEDVY